MDFLNFQFKQLGLRSVCLWVDFNSVDEQGKFFRTRMYCDGILPGLNFIAFDDEGNTCPGIGEAGENGTVYCQLAFSLFHSARNQ